MGYVISLMIMATIAVFSVFIIFKDKHPKTKNH